MKTAWNTSTILVLSFLTVLIAKSLALSEGKIYTNEYAVYIPKGKEVADKLAKEHGLSNEGQVRKLSINAYYVSASVHIQYLKKNQT